MSGFEAGRKGRKKRNQPQTQPASSRSSGQNPRPASSQSSGQNPRPASSQSSGQNPRPASSQSSGQNPRPASLPSSGQNPRPASSQSSGQKPRPASSQSSGLKPRPASSQSSGQKPRPASSQSSGQKPRPASSQSSGQNPRPASLPLSGQNPRPASSTSSGQNPRPASSTSSQPASSQSKEREPEERSTGCIKAGTEAATKGKHSGVTFGARGPSTVKGKHPTAASRPGNMSHQDNQKHMASSRREEAMEWEPEGAIDMTSFFKTDNKSPTSSSTITAERSTGKDHHSDSDWMRSGDKGQAQDTPPTAGGEGQQDDLEEGSEDPDEGGYVETDWEAEQTKKPSQYDNKAWKGEPLKNLKTTPMCLPNDLKLERSSQHDITIVTPFEYRADRLPDPLMKPGRWNTDHVRMPYFSESKCVVNGKEERRWNVIVEALQPESICGPFELEEAILKYNQRYVNKWKFTVLHHFFKHVDREEREQFFDVLLPQMIRLVISLPDICPMPIPLLKKHKAKKLTLSQHQISCLLANAFFCTFPLRNARTRATEYAEYPDINFSHLFVGEPVQRKLQKMHCIINYFKRVIHRAPAGIVTFSRQVLPSPHNWFSSMETLSRLHVSSAGTIEDNGQGMLQVDFANKYLGGGVLGHGCVQEEIRFMICPEMIITRLFTQSLDPLESLVMTGCERFNDYEGYSDTFQWKGDYTDSTARDYLGRLCCEVVAIDAQVFRSDHNKQFKRTCIERELNKAYCGFKSSANEGHRSAVCTGKWGCGAFRGDKQLKALIQVMAASVAKRDLCFFTFGDDELTKDLFEVHDRLRRLEKTVGDVYCLLEDYGRMIFGGYESRMTLFEFINTKLDRDRGYHPAHNYNTHFASNTHTASGNPTWFDSGPEDSDMHGC